MRTQIPVQINTKGGFTGTAATEILLCVFGAELCWVDARSLRDAGENIGLLKENKGKDK